MEHGTSIAAVSEPQVRLVVLQPTPFCNIDCKYCYLPHRGSNKVISLDTVKATFGQLFSIGWVGDSVTVAWHAGEPLVVPLEFYRQAVMMINRIAPSHIEIRHNFQTNGTLVTDDWCNFFKRSNSQVGISIDGPAYLNDQNRVSRSGRGTFSQAIEGVRRLRRHEVDFHVISVLTAASLTKASELYTFFQEEGVENVGFNVEEIEGDNVSSSLAFAGVEESFEAFLREFWNLNIKHKSIRRIREIDQMLLSIVSPANSVVRNTLTEPFAILNVDCDGNFTTFCPEFLGNHSKEYGDFILGNVHTTQFEDARQSSLLHKLSRDIADGIALCSKTCDYFQVCGGGAPVNKLYENKSLRTSETLHCRLATKSIGNVALKIIACSCN
jgi:uncharacterized protein